MNEIVGDLFTWLPPGKTHLKEGTDIIRVITTNGTVKKNGEAVMGRGCALEAKTKWPSLPMLLGQAIANRGLSTRLLYTAHGYGGGKPPVPHTHLISFPVKFHWMEPANLALIQKSMAELVVIKHSSLRYNSNVEGGPTIVMPRPGCGNGRLTWDAVKPVLEEGIKEGYAQLKRSYGYNTDRWPSPDKWLYIITHAAE
jgi:hypothetical protein